MRGRTALAALCAAAVADAACSGLSGSMTWYDDSSVDAMPVTGDNCVLTSKYGKATVDGAQVQPTSGILLTQGVTGRYNAALGEIKWSNAMRWSRLDGPAGGGTTVADPKLEQRLHALEARSADLEMLIAELRTRNDQLAAQVASVATCSGCPLQGGTAPPVTAAPSPAGGPAPGPSTPAQGNTTGGADAAAVAALEQRVAALEANPVQHGYCSVQPNVTSVYVPVIRYPRRHWLDDVCVTGAGASRGPVGGPGVPSMATTPVMSNENCRWTQSLYQGVQYAYAGDSLVFYRGDDKRYNVWLLKDKKAWEECDFTGAKLLAGLLDLEGTEAQGKNFTYVLDKAGEYYFASDKAGTRGDERKEYCWDKESGKYPGQDSNWGRGVRFQVVALDPTSEVLAECPLYDPAKYGVSGGGQVDSESVEKLKGAVAAISRQLVSVEVRTQQRVRLHGNSGLTATRSRWQGTDAYFQETYIGSGPANAHNHADFKYTIGLGEFSAVLNGVQFTTRHNDYSMVQPDPKLGVDAYHSDWPPPSAEIEFPAVPDSVANAGSVNNQIKEMREYFRAFHEQNVTHRDYRPFFKANLCYMEGTWTEAQDDVAEPFKSDRHHIDADTWEDLHAKTNFMFNNGQKSPAENLPYLPTSFRGTIKRDNGDTFEPRIGQWFYRINCVPLKEDVPTKRFRVKNELHIQMGQGRPSTREQLAQTHRALFEMNPTREEDYKLEDPWPKGKTYVEYLDDLMMEVPGFDGPQGYLEDKSFGPICANYNGSGILNTARYTRYYANLEKDAMGQSEKKRGFNDMLFAAQTSHPRVSPQLACSEFSNDDMDKATADDLARMDICGQVKDKTECGKMPEWTKDQVSADASGAKCVWGRNECKYKKCWEQRWSYALPLEIIYTTPLTNWNPYNIEYFEQGTDDYNKVASNGRNGRKGSPYKGSNKRVFFRTPGTFFQNPENVDPADTSGGLTYVEDKSGTVREVRASGHWLLFPEIDGVGKVRQRYPIMPIHEHGSTAWKEVKALEEVLMGKESSQEIKDIIAETRVAAYGAELLLETGQGHSHHVTVASYESHRLQTGQKDVVRKVSTEDAAHSHYVEIRFDASRGVGKEWYMTWCTTMTSAQTDACPESVQNEPDQCGETNREKHPCCWGKCPDNHPGVSLIL